MKVVKQSVEIMGCGGLPIDGKAMLKHIEMCGRVCYKSEDKINDDSAEKFVRRIIKSGHESVLEHASITVRFICDRGVSHEIVRHRIASYSQESTRYCDYSKDKFGGEISVIEPVGIGDELLTWKANCDGAEAAYKRMIRARITPQAARSILPTCLKTELIMTANLREWRHFLRLRTSEAAHPQMRALAVELRGKLREAVPVVFDDVGGGGGADARDS